MTRRSGMIRKATRNSATKASAASCAGLAPKRAATDRPDRGATASTVMAGSWGLGCAPAIRSHARRGDGGRVHDPMWALLRRQRLLGERLGLGVVFHREGIPFLLELGLAPGDFLTRLHLLERTGDRLVARLLLAA